MAFDTVIFLTSQWDDPAVLASLFCIHNPHLSVCCVVNLSDLIDIPPEILRRARLVAVTTDVIVPRHILGQLGYGAYNFHPGPPHFPGWAPEFFAIYHQATEFGATAHIMTERVDEGPIVGVELFPVPKYIDVSNLSRLTATCLASLIFRLAKLLATQSEPLPELPIRWSGTKQTRRSYAAICETLGGSSLALSG
jgi:methionyl-tRNA formyltransferase